jgi:hypothetical protein
MVPEKYSQGEMFGNKFDWGYKIILRFKLQNRQWCFIP